MPETSENPAPEPAVDPGAVRPRPVAWLRVVLLTALFATGVLVGVIAVSARLPASRADRETKAPRVIKSSVRATQSAPAAAPIAPIAAPTTPSAEPITITGSVADEFGRALADAMVLVGRDLPQASPGAEGAGVGELGVTKGPVPAIPGSSSVTPPRDAATVRTDQDGKFSISGIPSGNVQVFVTQPGYEPGVLALQGLRPGDTRDQLYIVLRTPAEVLPVEPVAPVDATLARVAGVVIDRLGQPVPQALVETDEGEASARTDTSGAFELVNVAPGALRIFAEDEVAGRGESQEVRARAGELLPGVRVHLPGRYVQRAGQVSAPTARVVAPTQIATPAPAAKATASPVLQAGVALEQRASSIVVNLVDKNSAASQAGLLAGDALLLVDGEPALSASQARGMLRDPAGVVAKVQVLRGKKRLTLRWKRPGVRYVTPP